MSREPVAWVFNLDAEDELARGGPHTPTQVIRDRVEQLLPMLRALMQPEDEVLWPESGRRIQAGLGCAWCPTPWALAQLRRAGLRVPVSPQPSVLRKVNHRLFAHALGQALPGARFVSSESALLEALSQERLLSIASLERSWLLKRPLGYAGRGRRKMGMGPWSKTDRTWIEAAFRAGDGLQVEPFVSRELDIALHGWLGRSGALLLGVPTVQEVDASGTWQSTRRAEPHALTELERALLQETARATAQALKQAGYFGPFGLDAFRWRAPDGSLQFQPRCEVNARYSMGWAVGMAEVVLPSDD